jgi:transcriptional regulator with XRE-family HTH domain
MASLHRAEVSVLERGGRLPRIDTAIKLAAALDVSLVSMDAKGGWPSAFA